MRVRQDLYRHMVVIYLAISAAYRYSSSTSPSLPLPIPHAAIRHTNTHIHQGINGNSILCRSSSHTSSAVYLPVISRTTNTSADSTAASYDFYSYTPGTFPTVQFYRLAPSLPYQFSRCTQPENMVTALKCACLVYSRPGRCAME